MLLTASNDHTQVDVPTTAYSLAGFREWAASNSFPELGRITYYRQKIFLDMSPEQAQSHNKVKSEICRILGNLVADVDLGELYQDGMWFTHDAADLSNEADGMFVSWASLESGRIRLITSDEDRDGIEMRGTPDWVLEVVSNSSVQKDTQWLPEAYHRAGIREFWLVDVRGESIQFTIFHWQAERFLAAVPDQDHWLRSKVFDRSFKLERNKNRIGAWTYSLQVR